MRDLIRRLRLQRLRDKRDDLAHEIKEWGWAMVPSERRKHEARMAHVGRKIALLTDTTTTKGDDDA